MTALPTTPDHGPLRVGLALSLGATLFGLAPTAAAQCGEDALEDNDTCATATPITEPLSIPGLVTYRTDPDYFTLDVPPGEEIRVGVTFSHATADVDLYLYDRNGICGGIFNFLSRSISSDDDESITWLNTGATSVEVAIKVEVFPGSLGVCNTYDIDVVVEPPLDPCDPAASDDAFEDNDTCATAVPLPLGSTADLWASRDDEDFYSLTLQPGATLDARIAFLDGDTNLDLFLYDAAGPCGGGFGSGELAAGFTQTDDEQVVWQNPLGVALDVILHVDVADTDSCNDYDLDVSVAGAAIGTSFCSAAPNSTGLVGLIGARGTTSVAANDVTLRAFQLPLGSFAFFLNSTTQGFVPGAGGSQGNLCVSGNVGRHDDDILSTGTTGEVELRIDLTALPQPTGFVPATAGQTWHFQGWHRDVVGGAATSNLTNGVRILLTP